MVKDEIDILEKALKSALQWADKVILIDHDSTDGTWELIDEKLRHWDKVEVYGQIKDGFKDGLRARAYEKYRHEASNGDWWCRLDSDEFYIDDPKTFLTEVNEKYDVVKCSSFQYYFTEKDLTKYQLSPDLYLKGEAINSLKYFACNSSEARFVRHHNKAWKEDKLWPNGKFPNLIWPKHIRLKHFQYRYPEQMQHRLDLRASQISGNAFVHELRNDWANRIHSNKRIDRTTGKVNTYQRWDARIVESKNLEFDDGNIEYIVKEHLLDPILSMQKQIVRNILKLVIGRVL